MAQLQLAGRTTNCVYYSVTVQSTLPSVGTGGIETIPLGGSIQGCSVSIGTLTCLVKIKEFKLWERTGFGLNDSLFKVWQCSTLTPARRPMAENLEPGQKIIEKLMIKSAIFLGSNKNVRQVGPGGRQPKMLVSTTVWYHNLKPCYMYQQ